MDIIKNIPVPTGNILIGIGEKMRPIEFLSIGDYGKEKNLKADFMGLTQDIDGVPHGDLLPLTEKWVITISSQYGCSMGCKFCDVPKVGPGFNASAADMIGMIKAALSLHPEIPSCKHLNIHFARMGEPTFNNDVISTALFYSDFKGFNVHPVVSTMMPRNNKNLRAFLLAWISVKNDTYSGDAGLQLSINSTDEKQRKEMFNGNAMTLEEISKTMPQVRPAGRKYTLNFALADEYIIDPSILLKYFDPADYLCKITPMHKTKACDENGIETTGGYKYFAPYKDAEEKLKKAGYDVIVFVPSLEEDESRITCGNAILADKRT